MYITRDIEAGIRKYLFRGKAIIIYGPRQSGKTTLIQRLIAEYKHKSPVYFNCDEGDTLRKFSAAETSTELHAIVGDTALVVLDEAQRITDIGIKLKLLIDTYPKQQIIATGSSSFELANRIAEPLTGRAWEFWLYPLSVPEMIRSTDETTVNRQLEDLLLFGSYPDVYRQSSRELKQAAVSGIANKYLYQDILLFGKLKNAETIRKLLEALALQTGNEVSYNELGNLLGVNRITVEQYVRILEQGFVVFRLPPFSRNLRNELGKLRKIYFYDVGIRNALLGNFTPIHLRTDAGALWENFVVSEYKKRQNSIGNAASYYFWRTHDQQEIDLVVSDGGKLSGYEIKWSKPKKSAPKAWRKGYPEASWQTITRENYLRCTYT